mmetsp:Transcript_3887/g.11487  ORF Transcript_3887/g.11487 Transcript_3887/m.11487 type:complete len:212 (+) Transcript_3887:665-1300(+)
MRRMFLCTRCVWISISRRSWCSTPFFSSWLFRSTLSATTYLSRFVRARYTRPNLPLPSGRPTSKSSSVMLHVLCGCGRPSARGGGSSTSISASSSSALSGLVFAGERRGDDFTGTRCALPKREAEVIGFDLPNSRGVEDESAARPWMLVLSAAAPVFWRASEPLRPPMAVNLLSIDVMVVSGAAKGGARRQMAAPCERGHPMRRAEKNGGV